jgi:REP element-mobilizing transposase RayT
MSRTVNGEALFAGREKEVLRKMIRQVADFSGVEVLTFCLMNNHFHVLVRVPVVGAVSDGELIRRYRVLYPKPTKFQTASIEVMAKELRSNGPDAAAIRTRLLARMGDVSAFMKTLKQRFSTWFNKSHDRYGPLWADRFKSVLVEGKGNVLQTMAAYIDLNPVRAGIVEDPKDYRFCGYAEAVAGQRDALRGLKFITAGLYDCSNREVLGLYRQMLFGKGAQASEGGCHISREEAAKVLNEQAGQLPVSVLLRCRIRFFTEGAVIGSSDFVRSQLEQWAQSKQRKHTPKPRSVQANDFDGLAVLKNVRGSAFS